MVQKGENMNYVQYYRKQTTLYREFVRFFVKFLFSSILIFSLLYLTLFWSFVIVILFFILGSLLMVLARSHKDNKLVLFVKSFEHDTFLKMHCP